MYHNLAAEGIAGSIDNDALPRDLAWFMSKNYRKQPGSFLLDIQEKINICS